MWLKMFRCRDDDLGFLRNCHNHHQGYHFHHRILLKHRLCYRHRSRYKANPRLHIYSHLRSIYSHLSSHHRSHYYHLHKLHLCLRYHQDRCECKLKVVIQEDLHISIQHQSQSSFHYNHHPASYSHRHIIQDKRVRATPQQNHRPLHLSTLSNKLTD